MRERPRAQPPLRDLLVYALAFLMMVGFTILWALMGGP